MTRKILYFLTLIALVAGFVLTIVSFIKLCSSQCAATHDYRLFGFHFETIGMIFFPLLIILHSLAYRSAISGYLTALSLAGALGSELIFIGVQKFMIGSWCPVCLSIAGCVAIASIYYIYSTFTRQSYAPTATRQEDTMYTTFRGTSLFTLFIIGVIASFIGIGKINPLDAAQDSVKESITFGNESSNIEIYLFTDWQCPACRTLEGKLHDFIPELEKQYKIVFVDFPIHPETMNYTPYNLSFMMHNKGKYLNVRDALTDLSSRTGTPTEDQIEESVSKYDVTYKPLNFADVAVGMRYFKHLADEFHIDSTPTMVIINRSNKKGKKLYGSEDINGTKIKEAIDQLK